MKKWRLSIGVLAVFCAVAFLADPAFATRIRKTGAISSATDLTAARDVIAGRHVTVGTNLTVAGTATVTGASTLTGAVAAASTLDVAGATVLATTLEVTGATTLTGNVTAAGTFGVTGAVTYDGLVNADAGIAVDTNKFTVADATGNTLIAGTLAVTGTSALTGNTTVTGTSALTGVVTAAALVNANGGIAVDTTAFTVADTTGNVATTGTLGVAGTVTLDDGTGASPDFIMKDATDETATFSKVDSGYLTVTTAAADGVGVLVGNLTVGNGTAGTAAMDGEDAYIEGELEVDGAVQFDGAVTAASTLSATAITNSLGLIGPDTSYGVISKRIRFTTTEMNAGASLVAAVTGKKLRLIDCKVIAIGGNAAATANATGVAILATQSAGSVMLYEVDLAQLTDDALNIPNTASTKMLANGASFVPNDAATAITVAAVAGTDLITATHFDVDVTYAIEA